MPVGAKKYDANDPEMLPTLEPARRHARRGQRAAAFRIAPPLLTLAFALMAVPLARSPPRQARYGRVMLGFLAYMVGMNLMLLGTKWLEKGKIAAALGLWWLVLPLLAIAPVAVFHRRPHAPGKAGAWR